MERVCARENARRQVDKYCTSKYCRELRQSVGERCAQNRAHSEGLIRGTCPLIMISREARRQRRGRSAEAVGKGALASLDTLNLSDNEIGEAGMTAFADAVGKGALPQLEILFIYGNRIGDDGISATVEGTEAVGPPHPPRAASASALTTSGSPSMTERQARQPRLTRLTLTISPNVKSWDSSTGTSTSANMGCVFHSEKKRGEWKGGCGGGLGREREKNAKI